LKIRDSVVVAVSTAIQNGVIISVDFSGTISDLPKVGDGWVVYQSAHDFQLVSTMLPDTFSEVICKINLEESHEAFGQNRLEKYW